LEIPFFTLSAFFGWDLEPPLACDLLLFVKSDAMPDIMTAMNDLPELLSASSYNILPPLLKLT
jgi:hypothetical protein